MWRDPGSGPLYSHHTGTVDGRRPDEGNANTVLRFQQQGLHCTGKTGKMAKEIPCHESDREFGNFAKTQGILFAQVVNSLIL